jgi:hypothetical protein
MLLHPLIALMMEAASTSKTSVNSYQTTRRNNPEDSHLHDYGCASSVTGRHTFQSTRNKVSE